MFCTELLTTSTPTEGNSAYLTCKYKTLQIEHFSNFCLSSRYCTLLQLTNSAVLLSASALFAPMFLWKETLGSKTKCLRTEKLWLHYHCSLTPVPPLFLTASLFLISDTWQGPKHHSIVTAHPPSICTCIFSLIHKNSFCYRQTGSLPNSYYRSHVK